MAAASATPSPTTAPRVSSAARPPPLRLLPPLVISDDLLREGLDVLADALSAKG